MLVKKPIIWNYAPSGNMLLLKIERLIDAMSIPFFYKLEQQKRDYLLSIKKRKKRVCVCTSVCDAGTQHINKHKTTIVSDPL
jgi:hypothetical protein